MAETQGYNTQSLIFQSKGLTAKYAPDRLPEATYRNLLNLESRTENGLATRYGRIPITGDPAAKLDHPLPGAIYALARLRSLDDAAGNKQTFRYAAAGTSLYRRAGDTPGVYTEIITGLSGKRFSSFNYRPDFSSFPYLFIADGARMVKDNGSENSPWGMHAPTVPAQLVLELPRNNIADTFDLLDHFTFS